ncbi:UNVERIFIED_CONTAM: 26S proteasome regulatory subunitB [Sesamum radiatum]|uniref:26S proteasome regulatory subunitB n=1 Tax=Sesamum radiatum TaxID=300843 RepID=A0AAW2IS32_SESRA
MDIGGCDIQKQEIREAVELPLTHHELYQQIGIDPPRSRGVLLHGPRGTGKPCLPRLLQPHCILHHITTQNLVRSTWERFYCCHSIQITNGTICPKRLQGPPMIRDVFRLVKETPAIIFIDGVDAIATAGFDAQTGAGQEVDFRGFADLVSFGLTIDGKRRAIMVGVRIWVGLGRSRKGIIMRCGRKM